jgi:hypothetical protein
MSVAPVLTPAEQVEVDRFGLHDEDILGDIAEHFDDELMCDRGDAVATVHLIKKCCEQRFLICGTHLEAERKRIGIAYMATCNICSFAVTAPKFDQIYRVVPL